MGDTFCRPKNTLGKYDYFIDSLSPSPIELGTREHPFKNFNLATMEIHNELSFDSSAQINIFVKEITQVEILKAQIRFLSLHTVEINIYSDDMAKVQENMVRPSIVLSDTSTIFSEKTFFNIYDRYELKAEIRNSLEDF